MRTNWMIFCLLVPTERVRICKPFESSPRMKARSLITAIAHAYGFSELVDQRSNLFVSRVLWHFRITSNPELSTFLPKCNMCGDHANHRRKKGTPKSESSSALQPTLACEPGGAYPRNSIRFAIEA